MTIIKSFGNLSTLAKRGAMAALLGSMTTLLVSCGGSGTTGGDPLKSGNLNILPATGSLYANVPVTLNVAGGVGPYFVTSNEQTVMPLNFTLTGNTFTTVPNQPGVTDLPDPANQTADGNTPFRTVVVTARDSKGDQATATFKVLQNFMAGYGMVISSTAACGASTADTSSEACSGEDSLISLIPISNGLRYANKQMRFTAIFGAYAFILDSTGITGPTVTSIADSAGRVTARIRVTPNAITQYGLFRLTDVATGEYREFSFVIKNANGANVKLSVLPATVSLGGATSAQCGTGTVNVFVFGGKPPYFANTTFPDSIAVTPPSVSKSGDAFTVQVFNPNICLKPGNVVFTDALGAFVTMEITTTPGTVAPLVPLTVAPSALCIADGATGVISIAGGNANKVINSSNPGLATANPTAGAANFTSTLTAVGVAPLIPAAGTPVVFTVSDGGATAQVNVTRKTTCP